MTLPHASRAREITRRMLQISVERGQEAAESEKIGTARLMLGSQDIENAADSGALPFGIAARWRKLAEHNRSEINAIQAMRARK